MQFSHQKKFDNLREIFDRNYEITRLYADYLQLYPELITKEMIDTVTEDGDISKEEAIAAIICEAFGLDFDGSARERILIRDYINRSVRILDAKKYENGETIGYEYVNLGLLLKNLEDKTLSKEEAMAKSTKHYGRFEEAARYVNPRGEQ